MITLKLLNGTPKMQLAPFTDLSGDALIFAIEEKITNSIELTGYVNISPTTIQVIHKGNETDVLELARHHHDLHWGSRNIPLNYARVCVCEGSMDVPHNAVYFEEPTYDKSHIFTEGKQRLTDLVVHDLWTEQNKIGAMATCLINNWHIPYTCSRVIADVNWKMAWQLHIAHTNLQSKAKD